MTARLEVWSSEGRRVVDLAGARVTLGNDESNDVPLAGDRTVSRTHAVIERLGAAWCIRDVGSTNGTFVNGERILAERTLRPDDEIRLGRVRVVFRAAASTAETATDHADPSPDLSRRERDVLVALCRPVLSADLFTEPASVRQIAEALFVTEGAVKQHLGRLYDKFAIHDQGERRRVSLANEAIRRGAVSLRDLKGA